MRDFLPHIHVNVSPSERVVSLLTGAWFMNDALGNRHRNFFEAVFAGYLLYRGATGNCAAYGAIGKTKPDNRSRNINLQVRQIVNRPRKEVYEFWRDFENLPLFMDHLENVNNLSDTVSVWEAKIAGGVGKIRWKSEIVKERPYEFIGWHSLPGSSIGSAGKVSFRDETENRTEVHVVISYHAPGGIPGEGAARFINPIFEDMLQQDINNFKFYIEKKIPLS